MQLSILIIILLSFCANAIINKSNRYNEDEALKLLFLSAASYGNDPEYCLNRIFPEASERYKLLSTIDLVCDSIQTHCHAFIVVSDKERKLFVSFRGSRTPLQVFIEGIDQWKMVDFLEIGKVHSYFKRAHDILWPRISAALNSSKNYKDYQITFTGHSLGGALASLSALHAIKDGLVTSKNVRVVTFGEPRVGDFDFAVTFDTYITSSYRIVNRYDIVPHFPACRKYRTFENRTKIIFCENDENNRHYHHRMEIWYPKGMSKQIGSVDYPFIECHNNNEDWNCSNSLRFSALNLRDSIRDHRNYFGVLVTRFGKNRCLNEDEDEDDNYNYNNLRNYIVKDFRHNNW